MSKPIKRIKAHYIKPEHIVAGRIPNFHDLSENTREMVPVKMKKAVGTFYHILEDKAGNVYLLKSDDVAILKLDELGLEKSETEYLLTVKERSDMMVEKKVGVAEGKRILEQEELEQLDEVLEEVKEEKKDKPKKTRKKRAKKTEKKDERD